MSLQHLILLGGHIQALGLARQAAKSGLDVTICVADKYSVAHFSKSVTRTYIHSNFEDLEDFLKTNASSNTLLFPTSDDYIDFIVKRYNTLSEQYTLLLPKIQYIQIFNDKRKAYKFIETLSVPQPKSWLINSINDIEEIEKELSYPIVIKPAIMFSFHKKFGKKAYLCNNVRELKLKLEQIEEEGYPIDKLLLQEFLSGGAPTLFSYGVFAVGGEPKSWIMANRIRQNPMDFGNSTTFAVGVDIPEIELMARKILKEIKYTGLAEIEFMYDNNMKQYKFLEINTRAWKWHTLSTAYGWGFMSELIAYQNQKPLNFVPISDKRAWVERLTDFAVIIKEILHKKMKYSSVRATYKMKKVYAVWDWADWKPFFMYLLMSPILYIKRH